MQHRLVAIAEADVLEPDLFREGRHRFWLRRIDDRRLRAEDLLQPHDADAGLLEEDVDAGQLLDRQIKQHQSGEE